ncbi:hypothetical protein Tco_1200803 [Tanacetum coccineum]
MTSRADQITKDNALVAPKNQKAIGKFNMQIEPRIKRPNETTYQVVRDALALTTCYPAFLISADVLVIYMHQFWDTVYKHGSYYRFKIDNKKFTMNVEEFREILNICPRIHGQEFTDPPYEEEALSFVRHLGHTGEIKYLTDITIDHLHQPWRAFAAIINKCLSGKDLAYQIENKDAKKSDKMCYPRFTKRSAKVSPARLKKRERAKADTRKGLKVLSKVALSEEAQLKKGDSDKDDDDDKEASNNNVNDDDDDDNAGNNDGDNDDDNNDDDNDDNDDDESVDDEEQEEEENAEDIDFSNIEDDEEKNKGEEDDYEMLYRDVNVNLQHEDVDIPKVDQGGAQNIDLQYEDAHLLNLENVSPTEYTLASMMDTTAQPTLSTIIKTTPLPPLLVIPPIQQATPTPAPTTHAPIILESTTSIPVLLDFALVLGYAVQTTFQSYKVEIEKEAQAEQERFIEIIDKSVKEMVKDEVKSQLTRILPKKIADFATPLIESTVPDSHERVVLAKSSSQQKFTYAAAASLSEFELKKILLDKMQDSESYRATLEHKELYESLAKSYKLDKDLFDTYGEAYSKTDKDASPSKEPKSKGSKSSSTSKGTSRSPHKLTGKTVHTEEPRYDSDMPHDQEFDMGTNDDQPAVEATKDDWFKKPDKPPTPDREWNKRQSVDFRPPQTWISRIAKDKEPPRTFNELMNTPIDFSAFVMNRLKIENLTQETLVRPAYDLLNGTCKSFVKLEYHFKEVYKAVNDRLEWNNPEGQAYPFDLSKPLPLIQDKRGRNVIPVNYFINNDLEYLKGGSSSRKYTTSTTKSKADMYDNILGIKDMVPTLWSPTKMAYDKHAVWGIKVRREDNQLYKFKEGDFPRLNLQDIEDLMLLSVQKKISNLEKDVLYDLNVALRMFTRRIVILKQVEDLQLGVESYQKKLNITRPQTFKSDITKLTPYTAYNDP